MSVYCCIDLKSFYASVECQERGLNPMKTNLVVADKSRTEKTICLAVSPTLKSYGIPGRARLYEVVQKVKEINYKRKLQSKNHEFTGSSCDDEELKKDKNLELKYIIAPPQMAKYMEYSTKIYNTYLKYVSPEDIFPYSIDEVFMDITKYLKLYNMKAKEFLTKIIHDVYNSTGITATGGIGTNLYLAKIAMDIGAKHVQADKNGVRIAALNEMLYRKLLWSHKPITDFWRVGKGYAKKLAKHNIFTMGDVARCSIENEELLYKIFGINAEFLIDHSWGYEPCTIKDIKNFRPTTNSISSGQVLSKPYNYEDTKLIVKEMADLLALDLVEKRLVTSQIVLTIGYDIENITNPEINYKGEITTDRYGRSTPKHAHGTINLKEKTSSAKSIMEAAEELYERIINKKLLVRRLNIVASNVVSESQIKDVHQNEQISLFIDYNQQAKQKQTLKKEHNLQHTILDIKKKYGKNAIIKGMNLEKAATTIKRNKTIGGHQE